MKKDLKNTFLWCAFVFGFWLFNCFELPIFFKTYIYFIAFSLSTVIIYFVKKEGLTLIGVSVVSLLAAIYEYEYLFLVMPVVLLSYAHCSAIKSVNARKDKNKHKHKHEEGMTDTYTTMSFILMIGQVIYSLVAYQNTQPHRFENIIYILRIAPAFILLFAFLIILTFVKNSSKENEIDVKTKNSLRMIYIVSLLGTVITASTFYAINGYGTQSYSTEYLFWFIFVMLMVLNKDPFIYSGIAKLENMLNNL